jgi:hydroxypyruvate isomerase
MKYALCLEMFYTDIPFVDRLERAKKDGINKIEFWDWRDKDLNLLKDKLADLDMNVCNMSGNRNFGMIDPTERNDFIKEVTETAAVAKDIGCPTLMLLVQSLEQDGGGRPSLTKLSQEELEENIIICGKEMGKLADEFDLDIVIEPLNTVLDHPRYELYSSEMAFRIIRKIGHPRVKILYDIYHMAMQGENVLKNIEQNLKDIGHFHVADKPGRNEPGTGEIDYPRIVTLLKQVKSEGIVGFELSPQNENNALAMERIANLFFN